MNIGAWPNRSLIIGKLTIMIKLLNKSIKTNPSAPRLSGADKDIVKVFLYFVLSKF